MEATRGPICLPETMNTAWLKRSVPEHPLSMPCLACDAPHVSSRCYPVLSSCTQLHMLPLTQQSYVTSVLPAHSGCPLTATVQMQQTLIHPYAYRWSSSAARCQQSSMNEHCSHAPPPSLRRRTTSITHPQRVSPATTRPHQRRSLHCCWSKAR